MSYRHGQWDSLLGPRVPIPDMEVRSADGGPGNPDENVHGADVRDRDVEELKARSRTVLDQCAHTFASWAMPGPIRLQSPSPKISISRELNPDDSWDRMTLEELGWDKFFAGEFAPYGGQGLVPARLIRETKINFSALLEGGEEVSFKC